MTLTEWTSTPAAIKAAKKLARDETFINMMEVLHNELPSNRTLPLMGAKEPDFIYAYGVEVGFRNCLAVIKRMSVESPKQSEIAPDFNETNDD
tara:strand:- start:274 stop:552 length:279 start_codon:yes stop_codon:yes gene_type:complete